MGRGEGEEEEEGGKKEARGGRRGSGRRRKERVRKRAFLRGVGCRRRRSEGPGSPSLPPSLSPSLPPSLPPSFLCSRPVPFPPSLHPSLPNLLPYFVPATDASVLTPPLPLFPLSSLPDTSPPPSLPPPPPPLTIFEKALSLSLSPAAREGSRREEIRLREKGYARWRTMVKQLVEVGEGGREGGKEGGREEALHFTPSSAFVPPFYLDSFSTSPSPVSAQALSPPR